MKTLINLFSILLISYNISNAQQKLAEFPKLTGPYLGQKPPGKTPEPFAADIPEVSRELHSIIIFSPDGKEAYWKPQWNPDSAIYVSRFTNGIWTTPKIAPFSRLNQGDDCPFISPDGKKLFFISNRSDENGGNSGTPKIWVMNKVTNGWSKPQKLPTLINSMEGIHWQFSVDKKGNLYFGSSKKVVNHMEGDIYFSRFNKGHYDKPEKLCEEINKPGFWQYSPFISPDGNYMIFTRQFQRKLSNLFISFRKKDGSWDVAKELNEILSIPKGVNSFVSSDLKYLFFLSGPVDKFIWIPYWVDAGFIRKLRPKE